MRVIIFKMTREFRRKVSVMSVLVDMFGHIGLPVRT